MPTYSHDTRKAFDYLKSNPMSRWYKAGADVNDSSGDLAVQRMKRDLFRPRIVPGFKINRKDCIFAIGSCFARGIEVALKRQGFRMESAATEFDAFELQVEGATPLGFTNKYTTCSILNELTWALDPGAAYPENAFIELESGDWVDTHTNPTLKFVDLERTHERRAIITEVTRRITGCRVVIITLGLIETWLDTATGLHMNMAPLAEMAEREPDRFVFEVLDFDRNRRNLEKIHALLSAHGDPGLQIVVTVSPVPLMATFSDRDVVAANTYSKSLLRTAAEEWAAAHENVHYFPSYEIALNSSPEKVWWADGRHVQGDLAKYIIGLFTEAYVKKSLLGIF